MKPIWLQVLKVKEVKWALYALAALFAVTLLDVLVFGFSHESFMLAFSGWFSMGSAVIAVFLVIQAMKMKLEITNMFGGRDPNEVIKQLGDFMGEIKVVVDSDGFRAILGLEPLPQEIKAEKSNQGGIENGDQRGT